MRRWDAAIKLGVSHKLQPHFSKAEKIACRNLATKTLQGYLEFKTILHWEEEIDIKPRKEAPKRRKGGNIMIPLVYFPNKTAAEIKRLRDLKFRITNGELDLKEEPVPVQEIKKSFKTQPNT